MFFAGKEKPEAFSGKLPCFHLACLYPGAGGIQNTGPALCKFLFHGGTYSMGPDYYRRAFHAAARDFFFIKDFKPQAFEPFQNGGVMNKGAQGKHHRGVPGRLSCGKFTLGKFYCPADANAETRHSGTDHLHPCLNRNSGF